MKRIGQRYVQFINRTYRRSSRFDLDPADLREIRLAANGGFALGNARFKAEIAEMIADASSGLETASRRGSHLSGPSPKIPRFHKVPTKLRRRYSIARQRPWRQ